MKLKELIGEINTVFDSSLPTRNKKIKREKQEVQDKINQLKGEISNLGDVNLEEINSAKQTQLINKLIALKKKVKDEEIKLEIDFLIYKALSEEILCRHIQEEKDKQHFELLYKLLNNAVNHYLKSSYHLNHDRKDVFGGFMPNINLALNEKKNIKNEGYERLFLLYIHINQALKDIDDVDKGKFVNLTGSRAKRMLKTFQSEISANLKNNPFHESKHLRAIKEHIDKKLEQYCKKTFHSELRILEAINLKNTINQIFTDSKLSAEQKEKEMFLALYGILDKLDFEDQHKWWFQKSTTSFIFESLRDILEFGLKAIRTRAKHNIDLAKLLKEVKSPQPSNLTNSSTADLENILGNIISNLPVVKKSSPNSDNKIRKTLEQLRDKQDLDTYNKAKELCHILYSHLNELRTSDKALKAVLEKGLEVLIKAAEHDPILDMALESAYQAYKFDNIVYGNTRKALKTKDKIDKSNKELQAEALQKGHKHVRNPLLV